MEKKIVSLGGSLIVPGKINTRYITKIKKIVLDYAKNKKIFLVCGGGKTCRNYVDAGRKAFDIKEIDADWIGIMATRLNAEFVRSAFGETAYEKVIYNPTKEVKTKKNIIIGAGWKPGCSSDMDAVLMAITTGADTVINLSNIDYLYDKDPNKFKDAKPIKSICWKEYLDIIGEKWVSSGNYPFDPVSSKKAMKHGITVIIAHGEDTENIRRMLHNAPFKGTVISN